MESETKKTPYPPSDVSFKIAREFEIPGGGSVSVVIDLGSTITERTTKVDHAARILQQVADECWDVINVL